MTDLAGPGDTPQRDGSGVGVDRAHGHRLKGRVDHDTQDRRIFACPHCGHELSMFREPRSSRAEQLAARAADVVGSWRFLLFLALAIIAWCVANVVGQMFTPHPGAMLGYLGTALTVVAVLQGPLILLTQRRETERDRARDIETFYISRNTEADIHELSHAISEALEELRRTPPPNAAGQHRRV